MAAVLQPLRLSFQRFMIIIIFTSVPVDHEFFEDVFLVVLIILV